MVMAVLLKMETMKKLLFLLLGVGMSAGVFAQTTEHEVKKQEARDMRTDVRAHKAATNKRNHDLAHARVSKAVHDQKTVSHTNKNTRVDAKMLRERGVDHPVTKAKREVKVQDDHRKDHTQ
jgi:hypothetical protein